MTTEDFDALCDAFESAWQGGKRPDIGDCLTRAAESARPRLLRELIQIELWWRRDESPAPEESEYQSRFPDDHTIVSEAFELFGQRSRAAHARSDTAALQADDLYATVTATPGTGPADQQQPSGERDESTAAGQRVRYFGEYELLREIARGGMGVVYRARQVKLNRIVALKMILSGQLAGAEEVLRFKTEAEAAANLDHPGIVPIFEIGEHAGQHFFSMGFVEGRSLDDKIKDGPLPPREAAELTLKAAQAIVYAHRQGVIHRDLKPANVLLDTDGQPRITDFGLARRFKEDSGLTATGQVLGTPAYMPPEQAGGDTGNIGPAADTYSLGAILYCLLTGRPPFQSSNVVDTLRQVLEQEPVAPTTLVRSTPKDLETICLRCLQKDPGKRYATSAELVAELQRYLNGEPILARPISTSERVWRWCRRKPALAGLSAVAGLLVLLLGIGGPLVALQQAALREQAESEREKARRAEDRAVKQQGIARANEQEATKQQGIAERKTAETEATFARSNFFLAQAMWDSNRPASARALLQKVPAQHRNIEWYLSHREFEGSDVTLYGHTAPVECVSYSPDGTQVASGGYDGTIKLWDTSTGAEVRTLQGHTNAVFDVNFSPDGTRIVSGSWDHTVKIWDAATGEEIRTLTGHRYGVTSVSFSPDGRYIASGSHPAFSLAEVEPEPGVVKLWDASSGRELKTLNGHSGGVWSVSFSPDGTHLVSGGAATTPYQPGEIKLWNVSTGAELKVFKGHTLEVYSVSFSSDGTRLASGSKDRTVRIWDVSTGEELSTLRGHTGRVSSVCFSPDGTRITSAGGLIDPQIKLWDALTGEEIETLRGHARNVGGVSFSPDGTRIASASSDATVRLWNVQTGAGLRGSGLRSLKGHTHWVSSVSFSPDGTRIASGSDDTTVRLWDTSTGEALNTLKGHTREVTSVCFSPDSTRIVSGSKDGTLKLWNTTTGADPKTFEGHTDAVTSVSFSPDGTRIASASQDQTIQIRDTSTGDVLNTLRGHSDHVTCVSFSPDGTLIASGSEDQTIRIWDSSTGEEVKTLTGQGGAVKCVSFSPDGRHIAAGGNAPVKLWNASTGEEVMVFKNPGGYVYSVSFSPDGARIATGTHFAHKLWDVSTGKELKEFDQGDQTVFSVSFSPDGTRMATGNRDKSVRLWDASAVEEFRTFKGHDSDVTSISISPDGTRVVSGGHDTSVRVWETSTGAQLKTLEGHDSAVWGVVFSPDGKRIASGSWDQTIRVWDSSTGALLHTFQAQDYDVTSLGFSTDGARLISRYAGSKHLIWDLKTGMLVPAGNAEDFPRPARSHKTADDRWLAVPVGSDVRLVDLAWQKNPRERQRRKLLARPKPRWHRKQFQVARAARRWYAATFHAAWLLKFGPSDASRHADLQEAHRQLLAVHDGQSPPLPAVVVDMLKLPRGSE